MGWVKAGIVVVLVGFSFGCRHSSQTVVRQLSAEQVADRAKLGTVSIVVEYAATVDMADLDVDSDKLITDVKRNFSLSPSSSREEVLTDVFSTLLADPGKYVVPNGKTRTSEGKVTSLGSGLVVTPDGYVVTNAHVVEPDQDAIKSALVASISGSVDQDVAEVENGIRNLLGKTMTPEAKERLQKELASQDSVTAQLKGVSRSVSAVVGYTGTGDDVHIFRKPCEVRKTGKAVPGRDVAICKMNGSDFATLPLAASLEDGEVRTGVELFIMGYPGDLALDSSFSLPSRLEPSLTSGHVSAVKEMSDGDWKAIQTDASISPGNSGGPALNNVGQVVGLATFSVQGERTQNLNFAVSVDVVREFLRDLQVTPSQSVFTTTYLDALGAYDHGDKRQALALLQRLNSDHPESSVVRAKLWQVNGGQSIPALPAATAQPVPTPNPPSAPHDRGKSRAKIALLFIGVALVLIVVVIVLATR